MTVGNKGNPKEKTASLTISLSNDHVLELSRMALAQNLTLEELIVKLLKK